jgi:hypothetical protein
MFSPPGSKAMRNLKLGSNVLESIIQYPSNDELVKSHIPYVVHASTSSARTEYQ